MSQSVRDLGTHRKVQSTKYYQVQELYEISRGRKEEWGIDGYSAPKTTQYLDRVHKFPVEKRPDAMSIASKRSLEPDPAKYSPDVQTSFKRNWLTARGKFLGGKKITIIDQIMKQSKILPGPGQYLNDDLKKKPVNRETFR